MQTYFLVDFVVESVVIVKYAIDYVTIDIVTS